MVMRRCRYVNSRRGAGIVAAEENFRLRVSDDLITARDDYVRRREPGRQHALGFAGGNQVQLLPVLCRPAAVKIKGCVTPLYSARDLSGVQCNHGKGESAGTDGASSRSRCLVRKQPNDCRTVAGEFAGMA